MIGVSLLFYKRAHFVDVLFVAVCEASLEIHGVAFFFPLALIFRMDDFGAQLLYGQLKVSKIRLQVCLFTFGVVSLPIVCCIAVGVALAVGG